MLRDVLRRSVVEGVLYAMMVGLGEFFFPAVAIAVRTAFSLAAIVGRYDPHGFGLLF